MLVGVVMVYGLIFLLLLPGVVIANDVGVKEYVLQESQRCNSLSTHSEISVCLDKMRLNAKSKLMEMQKEIIEKIQDDRKYDDAKSQ
jgi:hypothetical protein